jgi:hypothetical protein
VKAEGYIQQANNQTGRRGRGGGRGGWGGGDVVHIPRGPRLITRYTGATTDQDIKAAGLRPATALQVELYLGRLHGAEWDRHMLAWTCYRGPAPQIADRKLWEEEEYYARCKLGHSSLHSPLVSGTSLQDLDVSVSKLDHPPHTNMDLPMHTVRHA